MVNEKTNEKMYALGAEPNAIRALFAYGLARKDKIGADKVFDFSLGNPNILPPDEVRQAILKALEQAPDAIHGYTPGQGSPEARKAIADSINRRFGMAASSDNIYLTVGAAASLTISMTAIARPGDEFIVITPYFPEYKIWIEQAGGTCVEVPARDIDFRLDLSAIELAITDKTRGIILNSPNNPVGSVYSEQNIESLSRILAAKQQEFSRSIYIISDEPYREIVYEGTEVPYIPSLYDNTIVCYSYSKSLSLPGERIGYIYVSERVADERRVYTAVCGAGRALGFVCAPSLFQYVIKECVDVATDIDAYAENRKALTEGLSRIGYEFIEPQGAFYLWVKALEEDSVAFAERAKAHELLVVPSTSFGCEGWVRIGYCVARTTIINSLPAFAALMAEYRA